MGTVVCRVSASGAGRLPDGSKMALWTNLAVMCFDDVELTHKHSLLQRQSGRRWQMA